MTVAEPIRFPIPVLCPHCGKYSTFGNILPGADATFQNCMTRCAHCGDGVPIPDGNYRADETLGGVLFTAGLTRESALALIKYLRGVTGTEAAIDAIAERIATEIPGTKKENVLKVLNQHGVGVTSVVAMLLALLLWYIGPRGSKSSTTAERPVPAIVQPAQPSGPVHTHRRAHPKVGRNDLCSCGSGKKAKKCHPERCK